MQNLPPNAKQKINIDIRNLPYMECETPGCNSKDFTLMYRIKRVSPILTGAAKEDYVPAQLFVCAKCGAILEKMNPFSMIDEDEQAKPNNSSNLIVP